jgi:hypothetical protein
MLVAESGLRRGKERTYVSAPARDDIGPEATLTADRSPETDPGCSQKNGLSSDRVHVLVLNAAQGESAEASAHNNSRRRWCLLALQNTNATLDDLIDMLNLSSYYPPSKGDEAGEQPGKIHGHVDGDCLKGNAALRIWLEC